MRYHLLAAATVLLATPAFADVKAGVDAWGRGEYRKAVEEWRGPAVAGDADAQFNLGQAYKLGRGVPVDPTLAESWFRKAATQGHEQAGDNYALAMFQNGRKTDAVPWLEKSVARDEPRTELVYGTMLFNGDGVPRDYVRAYALMTRAAASRPARDGQPATDGLPSARETLAQMDSYIAPGDRQRGTALAQQYALTAASRAPQGARPMRVTEQMPRTEPVRSAEVSPPLRPAKSAGTGRRPPRDTVLPPAKVAKAASATPVATPRAPAATPAVAARGGWRVQLGAFRDRGNAEALWARVRAKLGGGAPAYVAGGGVTRLQATGFASKAAAQRACAVSGVSCVVVAP